MMLFTDGLFEQSVPKRILCKIGVRCEMQLLQQPYPIGRYGFRAQAEFGRDRRDRPALRDLDEDLKFPLR